MHYLGTTAARLKLKGIDGKLVSSGGACGLIRLNAPNLTSSYLTSVRLYNVNLIYGGDFGSCMAALSPCLEMLGSILQRA